MNKIIFKNGLFGGLIVSITLIATTVFMKSYPNKAPIVALEFASMFLAFLFIFIGIKQNKAIIGAKAGFWKSFVIGVLISSIISSIYVVVWLIIYYFFFPNFMETYSNIVLKHTSIENLAMKTIEINQIKELYKNPLYVILYTYLEILPLGILVSFLTATFISLKRKLLK